MRMKSLLRILIAVALSLLHFDATLAHVFRTGSCPQVDVVSNFTYEKFIGKWYVIEKSQTTSSCMRYNFTIRDDGSKSVVENYRLFGVKVFNNWNDFSQTGQLNVPNENPAKMAVQFPFSMNPFSPASFWVVGTDYDSYAALWSCRRFLFGHFQSAMILSRNASLDRPIINKMRNRFEFFGVDRSDFSVISQSDCNDKQSVVPPVVGIEDILANATSLKPTVVVTPIDESEVVDTFPNFVPPLVVTDNETLTVKESEITTVKPTVPEDSENMF